MMPRLPHRSPMLLGPIARNARSMALGIAVPLAALVALSAGAARAELLGGGIRPAEPTECDSVFLELTGRTPSSCYQVRGLRVSEPELLPTLGPIPTYRIVARVRVEELDPSLGIFCTQADEPYRVSAPLGRLPFGQYLVDATERIFAYPPDSMGVIDSSRVTFSFQVAPDTCRAGAECVLLGFASSATIAPRLDGCTVRTAPGSRACFDVTLANPVPVGGVQTEITVDHPPQEIAYRGWFRPVAVTGTARTPGFDVAWSAEESTAKVVLYSATDAAIAPGRGPILHVCYEVSPDAARLRYPIRFGPTIVASPRGVEIPHCPTFAPVEGAICLGGAFCDVNGDGSGDIRDVIRIVRCALSAPSDTSLVCPDSVRARADCTGDGMVDIRDVICCVRRILSGDGAWVGWGGDASGDPIRIGFDGGVTWVAPETGRATISVGLSESFGGIQWLLEPSLAARVEGISLDDPLGNYALDWEPLPDGVAKVMLYRTAFAEAGAAPGSGGPAALRVSVTLAATTGGAGVLTLTGQRGANASGDAAPTELGVTDVEFSAPPAPNAPAILPARPNPFAAGTEFSFSLPEAAEVSLRIFDLSGRYVRTLVSGPRAAGLHHVRWDGRDARGRDVGNGIYFVRLQAAETSATRRLIRIR